VLLFFQLITETCLSRRYNTSEHTGNPFVGVALTQSSAVSIIFSWKVGESAVAFEYDANGSRSDNDPHFACWKILLMLLSATLQYHKLLQLYLEYEIVY
jgi:hypothetical protein